jgi:hypothetical protein
LQHCRRQPPAAGSIFSAIATAPLAAKGLVRRPGAPQALTKRQ